MCFFFPLQYCSGHLGKGTQKEKKNFMVAEYSMRKWWRNWHPLIEESEWIADNSFKNHLQSTIYMPAFVRGARGQKVSRSGFCPRAQRQEIITFKIIKMSYLEQDGDAWYLCDSWLTSMHLSFISSSFLSPFSSFLSFMQSSDLLLGPTNIAI